MKEAFGEKKYVWVADFSKKRNEAQWSRLTDGKAILGNIVLQSPKPGLYKQDKKVIFVVLIMDYSLILIVSYA